MNIFSTLEAQCRRSLLILFAAGLVFWSSLTSLLPTLAPYIEEMGGSKQQVGIVMGSFAIGLLLSRPKLGYLADYKSRKLVVIVGTSVAAIAPLGYLFIHSIPLLIALRIFHGVSIAAFTTGFMALVTDLSPIDKRGEVIGYMSLTTPIGMAFGPALGGFIQASAGYTPLFLFASGLGLLATICAIPVKESPRLPVVNPDRNQSPLKAIGQLLVGPRLRIPTLLLLLVGFCFGSITTFMALFIKSTGVDLNPGWFFTTAAIASFMTRFVTGKASDRYGRGLFITGSLIIYTLSMFAIFMAKSSQSFLVAGFLEGIGYGTFLPIIIALISDRSLPNERGQVFSVSISGMDLGIAMAGPILGSIIDEIGYSGGFLIAGVVMLVAVMIFITQSGKDLAHSLRFATGRERDIYALETKD
ncbi:MAG TPA: MFS transporter [Cyanobacteria bacterium UBA11149]|nr:MFS transporter [Cyanobacteria bacterium UBA11367]HBE60955.1 MFS transporter [Cyanobacteria bacterium UBA11366]HBK64585.1 MFS transporter [Cyanobacteria bacterium UBA11166]HBR76656.1 MFS transporter [Cyanobacteria bacterium UBA11159]HBS69552.1 MFS transporter [Cyanobacteria bacterium UBA11153]HBW87536.1 MFS transporter [Cyanobacteria bacterium UBA11149]HCA97003.1 MFS transporter [Cyanobacteria bacterium UBA9226]